MHVFLEIVGGRYSGTTQPVADGDALIVGSIESADIFLPYDDRLEPLHLIVGRDGTNVYAESLCGDVFINNLPVQKSELAHGDFIFAGGTLMRLTVAGKAVPDNTALDRLMERLLRIKMLGLLVDANLEAGIRQTLAEQKATFRNVRQDIGDQRYLTADPVLVKLGGRRLLLEIIVRSFWGKGRLVFFEATSKWSPTIEFYQSLCSRTKISSTADLRIYDPRVLRVLFGEAESTYSQIFFGAAERYLVESQLPGYLFEFSWGKRKVCADLVQLTSESKKSESII